MDTIVYIAIDKLYTADDFNVGDEVVLAYLFPGNVKGEYTFNPLAHNRKVFPDHECRGKIIKKIGDRVHVDSDDYPITVGHTCGKFDFSPFIAAFPVDVAKETYRKFLEAQPNSYVKRELIDTCVNGL